MKGQVVRERPPGLEDAPGSRVFVLIVAIAVGLAVGFWVEGVWVLALVGGLALLTAASLRYRWIFFVFLAVLPLQNFEVIDLLPGMVWTPTRLLVPLFVLSWAVWRMLPSTPPPPRLGPGWALLPVPAALMIGTLLLSVLTSRDRDLSVEALPRLFEHLAVFVVVADVVRRPAWLRPTMLTLGFSTGLAALWSISVDGLSGGRLGGLWDQPNSAANYLVVLLPFLLYAAHSVRSRLASALAAFLALCTVLTIVATFSRGGLLALLVVVIAFYFHRLTRLTLVGLVLLLVFLLTPFPGRLASLIDAREASVERRFGLAEIGLRASLESPWTGYGFNTFRHLHEHTDIEFPTELLWKQDFSQNLTAHNAYLLLLVETGVPCLAFLAWFWLVVLWRLRRQLWERPAQLSGEYGQVRALLACSLGLLVSRVAITQFLSFAFWVPFGLALGALLLWGSPSAARRGSDG